MSPEIATAAAAGSDPESAVSLPLVSVASEADRADWDAFVAQHPQATAYHDWNWRAVIARSFGHESIYFIARRDGRIAGVLPLVYIDSWLFSRSLTSLPFFNYGGVLADADEVARALLAAASELARQRRVGHVEFRHFVRRFEHLPCKQHKVTMRLPLQTGLWDLLDRKVRNQIRKAEKSGLTVERGGAESLDLFYTVFARNMRDLGTPVYARQFFANVLDAFPQAARLVIVRLKGAPIAAGLTFRHRDSTEIPWASSIRDYNSLCPNHLLYWHALESAVVEGCATFDFGRSTPNEGTYKFKEQWGAQAVPLVWEYFLPAGGDVPDQSPKNKKFRLMINTWQRCPLWLTNLVGPYIVRSIP